MSDVLIFGDLPTGRRLETDDPGRPANHWGTISRFPRATPERIVAARKTLPEIPDERLDRTISPWSDSATGATYELVRGHLDLTAQAGAAAFTVSDGNILGCAQQGRPRRSRLLTSAPCLTGVRDEPTRNMEPSLPPEPCVG